MRRLLSKVTLPRAAKIVALLAVAYVIAALASCYDYTHPPVTPGGDPSDYPPLTDSKAHDAGRD